VWGLVAARPRTTTAKGNRVMNTTRRNSARLAGPEEVDSAVSLAEYPAKVWVPDLERMRAEIEAEKDEQFARESEPGAEFNVERVTGGPWYTTYREGTPREKTVRYQRVSRKTYRVKDRSEAPAPLARKAARNGKAEPIRNYRLTSFRDIEMRPTHWLWSDEESGAYRIPIGELSLFAGHGDVGKSTASMWLVSQVSRGRLPGELLGEPRNCLVAAAEDSRERTIRPRLYVAKADLSHIFYLDVETTEADGMELSLPKDFGMLREAIQETKAAVCFFDSLMSVTDLSLDMHKGRDARAAFQPLGRIANETDCAIIGNVHFNKSSSSDPAMRLLNSVEIRNVARSIIYFAERDGEHVLSRGKGNLGQPWPALKYTIEDASFIQNGSRYQPGRFVLGEESDVSAQDMLRGEGGAREGTSRTAACAVWLSGWIAEQGGSAEANAVYEAGAAEGYSRDMLKEAKKRVGLFSQRVGFGRGALVTWCKSRDGKGHIGGVPGVSGGGTDGS
jgi:hypothetical protein